MTSTQPRYWQAMSQQNGELLRRACDAFNRRDLDAYLALTDVEVEAVPRMAAIEGGYHGHEGTRRFWGSLLDSLPDFAIEIVEVRDLGDLTVAELRNRAHGAGGETPVEQRVWMVAEWRDEKVVWWSTFGSEAEALEAVDLRSGAMSRENVEVVRRVFGAFEGGGWDEVARLLHPDVEWRAVEGAADDVGLMRGHDALRQYYQDWIDTMDQLHTVVEGVIFEADERVAVVLRHSGRGRASGVQAEGRYYVVCTVRDGQVVSGREYETREEALEAIGLRE